MDPNANLGEQMELLRLREVYRRTGRELTEEVSAIGDRLTELRQTLYQWLSRGGFAPRWTDHAIAARTFRQWMRRRGLVEYGLPWHCERCGVIYTPTTLHVCAARDEANRNHDAEAQP